MSRAEKRAREEEENSFNEDEDEVESWSDGPGGVKRNREPEATPDDRQPKRRKGRKTPGIVEFSSLNFKQSHYDEVRKKNQGFHWASLRKVYEREGYDEAAQHFDPNQPPNHLTLSAPWSTRPQKHYCDVSGQSARYRDPKTGLRYAHSGVFNYIRTVLDRPDGKASKYLDLRGEYSALK